MSLLHFHLVDQVIAPLLDFEGNSLEKASLPLVLSLSQEDLHHAQVLRLKPGEHIAVIDASKDYFECELVSVSGEEIRATVSRRLNAVSLPHISLIQGLPKSDKMEGIIRHATEIGIKRVVAWQSYRSIAKLNPQKAEQKRRRWQEIARSASMQSGRIDVPKVGLGLSSKDLASYLAAYDYVFVCYEEAPLNASLSEELAGLLAIETRDIEELKIALVIGPEGGIDAQELELLQPLKTLKVVSLGSTILRTETAALVACALAVNEYNRVYMRSRS